MLNPFHGRLWARRAPGQTVWLNQGLWSETWSRLAPRYRAWFHVLVGSAILGQLLKRFLLLAFRDHSATIASLHDGFGCPIYTASRYAGWIRYTTPGRCAAVWASDLPLIVLLIVLVAALVYGAARRLRGGG